MENWIFPLTILPGIGLMIMSTTNWSIALSNEINTLLNNPACDRIILKKKIHQLALLNIALVVFYVSASVLVLGGFLGSVWNYGGMIFNFEVVPFLVIIAIALLLVSTTLLIVYAYRAVRIKRKQYEERL